jgi:hypothetical protein
MRFRVFFASHFDWWTIFSSILEKQINYGLICLGSSYLVQCSAIVTSFCIDIGATV